MTDNTNKKVAESLWKLIMARGIVLVVVGLVLLLFPQATLTTLIFILGIYWLIDGVVTLYNTYKQKDVRRNWWWGLITGGLSIIAGLIVVLKPFSSSVLTTSFLMWFLGLVALINGITGVVTGIRIKKYHTGERSMIWGGIFSIVLGIILISSPYTSALVVVKVMGSFAIFAGIITILLANRVKKKAQEMENN
ncbi:MULTISPECIES: HdeD family acid-resistance protein [Draconibacterium]|uniref:HdeD family acid-resistance protein n=1 Tax=Draconibacterium sediminis TaxID=1544798 RepID=A0A0D8J947_9BACT|nr:MULTISPECIES: DUF308 domain-containing protein [Draconibacterium]KJF42303.1 hypothetical protein LH29_21175 [Draconibacterium sediminis]